MGSDCNNRFPNTNHNLNYNFNDYLTPNPKSNTERTLISSVTSILRSAPFDDIRQRMAILSDHDCWHPQVIAAHANFLARNRNKSLDLPVRLSICRTRCGQFNSPFLCKCMTFTTGKWHVVAHEMVNDSMSSEHLFHVHDYTCSCFPLEQCDLGKL